MIAIRRSGERRSSSAGFELLSWYFFRVSGLLLIGLILGHIAAVHLVTPIDEVDYAFVQGRYATPFWRIYDWLMLTLVLLHGINGLRIAADDYLQRRGWRVAVAATLAILTLIFFLIGTYNIIAFE